MLKRLRLKKMKYKISFESKDRKGTFYIKSKNKITAYKKAKINILCKPEENMKIKIKNIQNKK